MRCFREFYNFCVFKKGVKKSSHSSEIFFLHPPKNVKFCRLLAESFTIRMKNIDLPTSLYIIRTNFVNIFAKKKRDIRCNTIPL